MKKTIEIKESIKHNCHVYQFQNRPQGTFLLLDPSERWVKADYNADSPGTICQLTFHGRHREYAVSPYLSAATLNHLMEKLEPLFARVCDAYYEEYNAQSNLVARLEDDGVEAEEEIERYIEGYEADLDEVDKVELYEAADWFAPFIKEIKERIEKGEQVETVLNDYLDHCEGELLIPDLDEYVEQLKDELI